MKIYRILLVMFILLTMVMSVFSADDEGSIKPVTIKELKKGTYDVKYFVYDFLRHKYLQVSSDVAKDLFSIYIDGELNEWQKYAEYKEQYVTKSGKVLREKIVPFREDKEQPVLYELFDYVYKGNTLVRIDRYVAKRAEGDDEKSAVINFFKLGYLDFNYSKDGNVYVGYYVLVKEEIGERVNYKFVKYMEDGYLPGGVLSSRTLTKDIEYKEGMPIVGKELVESLKFLVVSPYWDTETVEEYTTTE